MYVRAEKLLVKRKERSIETDRTFNLKDFIFLRTSCLQNPKNLQERKCKKKKKLGPVTLHKNVTLRHTKVLVEHIATEVT